MGAIAALALFPKLDELAALVGTPPADLIPEIAGMVMTIAQRAAIAYLVIAAVDYVWQRYKHEKGLRMDHEEIKQEFKQQGLPAEIKSAQRRRAMELSRARMMDAVPTADVIVTNPTHYSVALKYESGSAAPIVVAKGVDNLAFKIREAAKDAGVMIVPDPPLARTLYANVEIGRQIPEDLFHAVAQLLAYVYRVAGLRRARSMNNILSKIGKHADLAAAGGVVLIVAMLIIPLPPLLLDFFITLNISAALMIVVATMYVPRALDFSSFPTILLLTTLFRLAINVSVTRLILLEGDAGHVVEAFGNFVVGGNIVVGLVIFLILIVIQFVVITNGAGRVAEVGARFTLDAMPGKQMAIDADLNTGQITDEEARKRRAEVAQEADFYGAMDGASKFVKGDAMAGILITGINLLGGIIIGVVQQGMPFAEAGHHFSLLSIGDGLCAQIPALLISVATGILVTRSAGADDDLGSTVSTQILDQRKAPLVAGVMVMAFGLVPGLPKLPFFVIGALFFAVGWSLRNKPNTRAAARTPTTADGRRRARPGAAAGPARRRARRARARPARARDRLRPGAARRPAGRRHAARPRRHDPPPDRLRARHGHPAGPHPRRRRPGLARVRHARPWHGSCARRRDGGAPYGHEPGRRHGSAAGHPDHRAGLRPPGRLDPGVRPRRGRGAGLDRRRRRVGRRHPPHRDDPRARLRAAHPPGDASPARPAQGGQRGGRQRDRAGRAVARRGAARAAGAAARGRLDPRPRRRARGDRRQGPPHARPGDARRVRPPGAGPHDHRAVPRPARARCA